MTDQNETKPPNAGEYRAKLIRWIGDDDWCVLACDGRCDKAWGINNRPKVEFDPNEPDDYCFLADHEVGTAPADPGTYEGGDGKPSATPLPPEETHRMNRWCSRQCERSTLIELAEPLRLRTYPERSFNMPWLHRDKERTCP